jgi:predicted nucleotide-binding protein
MADKDILLDQMSEVAGRCKGLVSGYSEMESKCDAIEYACVEAGETFSGSYLGYHSRVYYEDFELPPSDAFFDVEGGLLHEIHGSNTRGKWIKYSKEQVVRSILDKADIDDFTDLEKIKNQRIESFEEIQTLMRSIESRLKARGKDPFVEGQLNNAKALRIRTPADFEEDSVRHLQIDSQDTIALQEGIQIPPHLLLRARSLALREPYILAGKLEKIARSVSRHLESEVAPIIPAVKKQGGKIFIGHGHSLVWRVLKDFLKEDLGLEPDEFNHQPPEGTSIVERLRQMLDEACFAFVVLTAEDTRGDDKLYPRMNVIHEAGLFQGRLGFEKAILLVEEGCEKFSNIDGLVVIPFSPGKIESAFEKVRKKLKADNLIDM